MGSMMVRCHLCKKPVRRYDVGAPSGITISLPGAESQDAERRRQIALRALSERLSKTEEQSQDQWPSMDNDKASESPTNLSVDTGSLDSVESVSPSPQTANQATQEAPAPEIVIKD